MNSLDQTIGQLMGLMQETMLRLDRFEVRQTQIEDHLVTLISEIRTKAAGAAMIGALCGAFAGAITGGLASLAIILWMTEIIAKAAQ